MYAKILTHQPGFRKLTPHEQILFLHAHGIKFTDVTDWGKPTPLQQEAIDLGRGAAQSVAEQKMDGNHPRSK